MRLSWLGLVCLALMSAPAWSQQSPGTTPPGMMVAPSAPNQQAEMPQQGGSSQPDNICKELVAFLEEQAKKASQASSQTPGTPQSAGQAAAQGGEKVQQSSGQSAPIPQGGAAQGPAIAIEQARAWSDANDVKGCQEGTRRLRKAGIALPPGLLALAALKPELVEKMKP